MPTCHPATPGQAAHALARKECRAIVRALAREDGVHEGIHVARKAIRRLRALLQLVEPRLDDVAAADRILRRTGDSLSALRDAHVAIATAAHLASAHGAQWQPVVAYLSRRRDALLEQAWQRDPGFERRRAWIGRVARRLDGLPWNDLREKDLRRGLERSHRRVDRAGKRAARTPTAANLHRGRRRVRRLRMQMQAVARIAPGLAADVAEHGHARRIKALHRLSDRLGRRQDLEVLSALLQRSGLPGRRALAAQLDAAKAKLPAPPAS